MELNLSSSLEIKALCPPASGHHPLMEVRQLSTVGGQQVTEREHWLSFYPTEMCSPLKRGQPLVAFIYHSPLAVWMEQHDASSRHGILQACVLLFPKQTLHPQILGLVDV